ncbi:hypothetical protein D3880_11750 [Pseudomonas cavernae]|uniref:Acetoacetate decarboxylase n=1 Tax=Pseudomonas cavernae TaxID=2320867 RepID=A0A385Z1P1_9PSED|nr:acetoacetate decarboxylase family protein [Pseudomonas cavernae]AYC32996.1 hypothetical protein D3880_11750 [Pseudomonas cavernae]
MSKTDGYSLPECAPLFERPPYSYRSYRKLSAFCRTDAQELQRMLPAGFELTSDLIEVFIMDVPDGGSLGSYREGGIVAQVRFGEYEGGHVLYEYVTTDDSMAAGREIWGYPKKIGEVEWLEQGGKVSASLTRRGRPLIAIEFIQDESAIYDKPVLQPRLQVKKFPSADGRSLDIDKVILNELRAGTVHSSIKGRAQVSLNGWEQDPLHKLSILEVIGAEFLVADFILEFARELQ